MQIIPDLPPGATAECHRCDRLLERRTRTGFEVTLACAIAIFILLPAAVFMPLLDSTIKNLVFEESRLVSTVPEIYSDVWFPFAFGFFFFAFLFPALRAMFQILVLGSIRFGWNLWQRGRIFRWSEELRMWSMTDIVVIAIVAAYYRAAIPAQVAIRVGAWSYLTVAAVALLGDRSLDRRKVWNAILPDLTTFPQRRLASCSICEMAVDWRRSGDPCPRCGSRLDRNINVRFAPALGAIAAAIPLCIPSYSAAIMVNDQLTGVVEQTVLGTVQLLADHGFWQFGAVLLIAGVVIPAVVMVSLLWLAYRVRFPSKKGLVRRTRLCRLVRRLVRWPMIIPFIAAVAAPIVSFRGIDDIVAGPGATPLFMIIVLLMFAVRMFEPRLMWKAAGEAA